MRPEDVPAERVEKAADALSMLRHGIPGEYSDHTRTEVRHALAAVLPDIQAQALRAAARKFFFSHPDSHGDVMEVVFRDDLLEEAARLTATTEEPTT